MRSPKGPALRITRLGWLVTLLTLGILVTAILPAQKHEFELNLAPPARGNAAFSDSGIERDRILVGLVERLAVSFRDMAATIW